MKFTLYIPNDKLYKKWKEFAKKEGMSLALFIRLAVNEKIQRLEEK